ncbi:kinase-like domain-containing protein [Xylariaceae sp. FL1019]|nr:kinase-like domain-containing protein [Xylariaceae sp. FL1019]
MPPSPPLILAEFRRYMIDKKRQNWEGKLFYKQEDILWWMRQESNGRSNLSALLDAVLDDAEGPSIQVSHISQSIIVFAVLLDPAVDEGRAIRALIKCFQDKYIARLADRDFKRAEQYLAETYPFETNEARHKLIKKFKAARFAYCPQEIFMGINESLPHREIILPFCSRTPINSKGGTANVHHCLIQEDLVPENLRRVLKGFSYELHPFGKVYDLAVKSYRPNEQSAFELEESAFRALRNEAGVIKFVGLLDEYHEHSESLTHNLLLEYGEEDLDEYLANKFPPLIYKEVRTFWESFIQVAKTLERLHTLKIDGKVYAGWHGDVKPDNILHVKGEFKLADFGFTKFQRASETGNLTNLLGLTRSYGSPEIDRSDGSGQYTQKIDTWSLGCVFSAVASWVVLGQQHYDHYPEVRKKAIENLRNRTERRSISSPRTDDAFHDGVNVLDAVLNWHTLLRNSLRRSDTLTGRILDVVEDHMLVGDVEKRMTIQEVCTRLENAFILADDDYQRALTAQIAPLSTLDSELLETLLRLDEAAPEKPTTVAEQPHSTHLTPRSIKVRKSEVLKKNVRAKVASRQEAINSQLAETSEVLETLPRIEISAMPDPSTSNAPIHQTQQPIRHPPPLDTTFLQPESIHELPAASLKDPAQQAVLPVQAQPDQSQTAKSAIEILHEQLTKSASKWTRRKKDKHLEKFVIDRDIKFVVDNSASMIQCHWKPVRTVLETLGMLVTGLDKDGVDLEFTIGAHKKEGIQRRIPREFGHSMDEVRKAYSPNDQTNMKHKLETIFDKYLHPYNYTKRMTLIILTDGLWYGQDHDDVERTIAEFLQTLKDKHNRMESRWCSIQFVSFGDDMQALNRLDRLDNNMKDLYKVEDVIDTKPWNHNQPYQLITGSIQDGDDGDDGDPSPSAVSPSVALTPNSSASRPDQGVSQPTSTASQPRSHNALMPHSHARSPSTGSHSRPSSRVKNLLRLGR